MTKRVQEMTEGELRAESQRIDSQPWSARHADLDWELAERKQR